MKKKVMRLVKVLCVIAVFCNGITVEAAEDLTLEQKAIYQEYKEDVEFKKMVEKYGDKYIKEYIDDVISARIVEKRRGGGGNICYQYVSNIKQINGHTCGPTTVLQTLYGLGCASKVSGSNDNEKINTLAAECGTNEEGTFVGEIQRALSKYSDRKYVYNLGSEMTMNSFEDKIAASLTNCKPVVLHARTKYFDYYGGKNSGHYISLDYVDRTKDTVRVVDCNNNDKYFGIHYVTLEEAYNSIHVENDRYLIW